MLRRGSRDLGRLVPLHRGRVRELTPATLILGRVGLGRAGPRGVARSCVGAGQTLSGCARTWSWLTVIGTRQHGDSRSGSSPWGQPRIDSGLAAIIQAATDLHGALRVRLLPLGARDRPRLLGVVVGFVGVVLLVGASLRARCSEHWPSSGSAPATAIGGLLRGRHLPALSPTSSRSRRRGGRRSRAAVRDRAGDGITIPGWKAAGLGGRARRRPRPRSRTCSSSALIARRGRREGVARHVPRAADRARLRRDLPRRALGAPRSAASR